MKACDPWPAGCWPLVDGRQRVVGNAQSDLKRMLLSRLL